MFIIAEVMHTKDGQPAQEFQPGFQQDETMSLAALDESEDGSPDCRAAPTTPQPNLQPGDSLHS